MVHGMLRHRVVPASLHCRFACMMRLREYGRHVSGFAQTAMDLMNRWLL